MPMPSTPIIDTHVHLWNPERFAISWLAGEPLLDQIYLIPEFRAHTQGLEIEAFVYVEVDVNPAYALAEAHYIAQIAAEEPRLRGIVPYAPVEDGLRLRGYLDALVATSPLVKGVRRILQGEADAMMCLQPDFITGVQLLAEYGLSFDLCITHSQLTPATELVRRCPETQFMLDHIAKPAIARRELDPWREDIGALAALPNVYCKVSGLVTEANRAAWQPAELAPYVGHVLAAFGEDRVAYGSDWPVALVATNYRRWVETLQALTSDLSASAQRKLWAENAQRFYRL